MTTRQFLSDTDLDALLAALTAESIPVSTLDQLDAASREAAHIGQTIAAHAVAAGGHAFLGTPGPDRTRLLRMIRPRLRMLLATFSADVTRLCPHTDQIRPQMVTCDPPTLNCMQPDCMAHASRARGLLGIQWDHQCDACGQHAETLTPHLLGLGPLSISGHLCATCTRDTHTAALDAVDNVQHIGRKSPCPCGSGRRFKRCHGRQHATA
ncbi:SEC-C metal-binding domain-containing protein [Streptomyces stelliscabiei]|uniref:SEC-C metal-binding domain-containing protein n=1 Tax=Streptomyces stelliscabiei TaxID=146820 RepID=UPI0029A38A1B|nr:SEC-C metal-binding domain-containing protein [Streptomyces stelliscabiei]MDX2515464.1 SEC-C metal-binding domain-containing protein [Streptomyces stelliscabiei]